MGFNLGSRTNPNNVEPDNKYAGFVAPSRPDQSLIAGAPGSYYPSHGEPGNRVNPARINKTWNTSNKTGTNTKPLGDQGTTGY